MLFIAQLQAQTIVRGPYLQKGSETSVTVKWRTSTATQSKIDYGTNLNNLNSTENDNTPKVDHEIQINGLNPSTEYYYEVADNNGVLMPASTDLFFKTHPTIGTVQPISVWVLGDCGTGNTNARNVRDAYYNYAGNNHTDAILMLGDNAYGDGTDLEYQDAVFENMYEDKLQNTILWSCIGNHDGHSANSNTETGPYYDIFTFPTSGESGGLASGTESFYSFDYGNIHFICLNSTDADRNIGSPMYVWAENDIQNTTQDWIVAYWHHPAYTKGSHDSDTEYSLVQMRENFVPMLEDNGIDLVLSGHSHTYERSYFINGHHGLANTFNSFSHTVGANGDGDGKKDGDGAYIRTTNGNPQNDGAVYITTGSAGKAGAGSGNLDHQAMYYSVSDLGSCILEVDGPEMNVKFLRDNGNIDDYFTIKKETIICSAGAPCDDGNPFTINDLYDSDCFCNGTLIGASACVKINAGADDAEESAAGVMKINSSDIELVFDGSNQTTGFRFNNIEIPQGVTITKAYIQFTTDEESTDATNLTIQGEDTNNAGPFLAVNNDLSSRTKTSASVSWSPSAWNFVGASGLDQRTPDLSSILQEIVDRPGFSENNSVALFLTGTGKRIAASFEGNSAGAAQLCYTYKVVPGCPVVGELCDDNDPCTINDVIDNDCNCTGTFNDSDNDGICNINDQCPNFDDNLIGTFCDDGDPFTTYDIYTENCTCEGLPFTDTSVCRQVRDSKDDAEEKTNTGYVGITSGDLDMTVDDLENQMTGLRFDIMTIPQGASITNAYLQFTVDEVSTGTANLSIQGEAADNALPFSGASNNLSNRTNTTASVNWSPPDWNTVGAAGSDQQTPDLSSIIQEIVDRPNFARNNAVALFVTGTGTRVAESYDGNASAAAQLCVEFLPNGCTAGQPCNDNDPCTINDVYDTNCNCNGTFADSDNDSVCDANDQCPNFDDTLIGTACDDGDPFTTNDTYTENCICEGLPFTDTSVCRQVGTSTDDAEENNSNGNVNTTSSDIEMTFESNDQTVGLRFDIMTIPQGASITNAYVQFTVDEVSTGAANLNIQGEAADNALTFSGSANNISNRTSTTAAVNWSPPDWNTVGASGLDQQTPDLSAIIQEIVDRPNFVRNNAIALIVTGTGTRIAESYDGIPAAAAQLCVEFSTGCTTTGQPCNDNDPCTINDVIDTNCNCNGTFEDTDNDTVCDANDLCPNFDDTLIGTACDDGDPNTINDEYSTNCICEGTPGNSVCSRVNAGIDDVEENTSNGFVTTGSSDLEMTFDANDQIVGLRFNNITVPAGALITSAYVQFTVDETDSGASNLTIQGEAADNASTFSTTDFNLSSRSKTSATVNWSPPDWNTEGAAGPDQQTADLSAIIQEIVDRPGFSTDNSIALFITGTGTRTAESYNGDANAAPELCIEYSQGEALTFDLKVALEGAYNPTSGTMTNALYTLELLPGMLFSAPNNTGVETPAGQPYHIAPWTYQGTEGLNYSNSDYNPMSVDWVLLSVRTGVDASTEIHQAAGILLQDGSVAFFPNSDYRGSVPGPYYILIEHRNHIGALSTQAIAPQGGVLTYDFRGQNSWVPANGGFGQKELSPGFWGLYAGDGDQIFDPISYDINGADRILWNTENGLFFKYVPSDYNLNGEVTGADRILWNANSGINSAVPK